MKKVSINEPVKSREASDDDDDDDVDVFYMSDELEDDDDDDDDVAEDTFLANKLKRHDLEERAADQLSTRLLAVQNDDSDEEDRILRKSLKLLSMPEEMDEYDDEYDDGEDDALVEVISSRSRRVPRKSSVVFGVELETEPQKRVCSMILIAVTGIAAAVGALLFFGYRIVIRPPNQPVGPYSLVELQEGDNFFTYYSFYQGPDSVGSNGYLNYVSRENAQARQILNITYEEDEIDFMYPAPHKKLGQNASNSNATKDDNKKPFIYMGSAPTEAGPRDSIRLEGNRRFNRGLFIIDVRHMPAGCGVWPAFWLTDEANWPVHGEIDIVEGVNYQSVAKTALHSTKGCSMSDIPMGTMTGGWDTAQGIPDAKTGVPDMTLRYARNCFVYDPHQWLNQGCVAVDTDGDSLGQPLNRKGGGVFALEWDPLNRHIRTYVFSPHTEVPENLVDAIRTASLPVEQRIMPDPNQWPIPYGYFAIGKGTDCPASHFSQMRLVFNTAFCGSVSGNRFHLDCPKQAKNFKSCNEWIKSDPDEMNEAYWKIRGVYVYEREWERTWVN